LSGYWNTKECFAHVWYALNLLLLPNWIQQLNLGFVDFKLDSKLVVDNFFSTKKDIKEFGEIIPNCRIGFSFFCVNSSVDFRRQTNK